MTQARHDEWREQWSMFRDDELFLFEAWIAPAGLEDFRDKDVLECGCGGGQHTSFVGRLARSVTAVDLNTTELAKARNLAATNVEFIEADIATMELSRQFDVVFCIGVIHHTDDPDRSFANMYRHLRPGGLMIVWTYSLEGNLLVARGVEPLRKRFLRRMSRKRLYQFAHVVTALMYPVVHTVYRLSLFRSLPYYEYFGIFRRLSFKRNVLNVFDKLNAPQTRFTRRATAEAWMSADRFLPGTVSIRHYAGVSYSLVGVKRP